jgi:hypothetical protein
MIAYIWQQQELLRIKYNQKDLHKKLCILYENTAPIYLNEVEKEAGKMKKEILLEEKRYFFIKK